MRYGRGAHGVYRRGHARRHAHALISRMNRTALQFTASHRIATCPALYWPRRSFISALNQKHPSLFIWLAIRSECAMVLGFLLATNLGYEKLRSGQIAGAGRRLRDDKRRNGGAWWVIIGTQTPPSPVPGIGHRGFWRSTKN
jgi:hypothetical protein